MREGRMRRMVMTTAVALALWGCASSGPSQAKPVTLTAPTGTPPAAVKAMEEGNRLYAAKQWAEAKTQYEAAVAASPTLAEAHYNLGLIFDRLGDKPTAKKHYLEAANLAPGDKVIWDSWPLRRHGDVQAGPKGDNLFTPSKHAY